MLGQGVENGSRYADEEIYAALAENMESYSQKLGLPKASRWFSRNEQAALQLPEFAASRMVLEYYVGGDAEPDDEVQQKLNFKDAGGLKLSYLIEPPDRSLAKRLSGVLLSATLQSC